MAEITLTIKHGGADYTVVIDTEVIPERLYLAALERGLKDFVKSGITKAKFDMTGLEGEALEAKQSKVQEKIKENVEKIYADKTIVRGAPKKKSGVPKNVMTEAMHMARAHLKALMKKQRIPIAKIKASALTAAAQSYLETNPEILKKAYAIIEERESDVPGEMPAELAGILGEMDTTLSAKQAGMTRKRGEARKHAHN
jgi:vacuolar-type H+-ATPase subunit E/Vma4